MGKKEKELTAKIEKLIAELKRTEEALARANFENASLKRQVADLKADLESQRRKLRAIQG